MRIFRTSIITLVLAVGATGAVAVTVATDTIDGVTYTLTSATSAGELMEHNEGGDYPTDTRYPFHHDIATGLPDISGVYPIYAGYYVIFGPSDNPVILNYKYSNESTWDKTRSRRIKDIVTGSTGDRNAYSGFTHDWEGNLYLTTGLSTPIPGMYVAKAELTEEGIEVTESPTFAIGGGTFAMTDELWGYALNCARDGSKLSMSAVDSFVYAGRYRDSWITLGDIEGFRDPIMAGGFNRLRMYLIVPVGTIAGDGSGYFRLGSQRTNYPGSGWPSLGLSNLMPLVNAKGHMFASGDSDRWILSHSDHPDKPFRGSNYTSAGASPTANSKDEIFYISTYGQAFNDLINPTHISIYKWGPMTNGQSLFTNRYPESGHEDWDFGTDGDDDKEPNRYIADPQIDYFEHASRTPNERDFVAIGYSTVGHGTQDKPRSIIRVFVKTSSTGELTEIFKDEVIYPDDVTQGDFIRQKWLHIATSKNEGKGGSGHFDVHCLWTHEFPDNDGDNYADNEAYYRSFTISFEPAF